MPDRSPAENQQTVKAHAAAFRNWAMADDNRLSSWLITREEARAALRDLVAQAEWCRSALLQLERDLQIETVEGDLRPAMLHIVRSALARLDGAR